MTLLLIIIFLIPFVAGGIVGVKYLVGKHGKLATSFFVLAIPFYLGTVKGMIANTKSSFLYIMNNTEELSATTNSGYDSFYIFSAGMLVVSLMLFIIFSVVHRVRTDKSSCENDGHKNIIND